MHRLIENENPMVIDSLWDCIENSKNNDMPRDIQGNQGYADIHSGVFVPEDKAFDYAIEQCVEEIPEGFRKIRWTQEFKEMLVDWFYSDGDWVREE